jgi:hypothetical protein
MVSVAVLCIAASSGKKPEVQISVRSKAGNRIVWVHERATLHALLKGTWPKGRDLMWALEIEGLPRASGTVFMNAPGQPQREFEKTLEVSDEDYAAGRSIGAPEWLKGDPGTSTEVKSTRRRLRFELLIRDNETEELVTKGETEVMIEPAPGNRRE